MQAEAISEEVVDSTEAGISSESGARNSAVESLRFPGEGSSAQGKSGPKSRPNGVDDGQRVEIPVLPKFIRSSDTER